MFVRQVPSDWQHPEHVDGPQPESALGGMLFGGMFASYCGTYASSFGW
jgi:hypothetical protein